MVAGHTPHLRLSEAMNQTTLSRTFLVLLGIAFLGLTALRITGSSVVVWSVTLDEEKTTSALLFSP